MTDGGTRHRPVAVVAAALLAGAYAVVLLGLAAVLGWDLVGDSGFVAAKQLSGRAGGGVAVVVVALLLGALLLLVGARQALTGRGRAVLVAPLVVVLGIGLIGETADLLGTASRTSNAIGAGILVAAALPVALLATPGARRFTRRPASTGRSTGV